jgi:hypothetical protein
MRYRQRRFDSVYWPAFADILTVVIVVLVCTLVSVLESKPSKVSTRDVPQPPGVASGKPEPTRDEYLASLREARAKCLGADIRKAGLALTIPLCRFDDRRGNVCAPELESLARSLTTLKPDELTRRSGLDFWIQLRAVTELNGSFGPQARDALARGQDALRAVALWSQRLRDQSYQERPRSGAGGLYFDVTYHLQDAEEQEVERQWDDREYAALEQRRKLARRCELR